MLVERAASEHLLGLVMDYSGCLNLNFVKGLCERIVHTTYMWSLFYHWMVIIIWELVRSLMPDFWNTRLAINWMQR